MVPTCAQHVLLYNICIQLLELRTRFDCYLVDYHRICAACVAFSVARLRKTVQIKQGRQDLKALVIVIVDPRRIKCRSVEQRYVNNLLERSYLNIAESP